MLKMLFAVLSLALTPLRASADEASDPLMLTGHTTEGSAELVPPEGIAGQYGTWTVTYTVSKSPVQAGGGIRVQLPDEWHAGPRTSANRLQTNDARGNHYVKGSVSDRGVRIKTIVESERDDHLVKHEKVSLDGRSERYVFVVRVLIESGELEEGGSISVTYGDRSGGSAGYRASAVSTQPLPVLIAVDHDGDGEFLRLEEAPEITARPGSADEMWVHLPSQAVAGETVKGLISLVDQNANAIDHSVVLRLTQHTGNADFPSELFIGPNSGFVRFEVTPQQTGIFRLRVRAGDLELESLSNPMRVTGNRTNDNIYWGDLHSHSHFSWDGVGRQNFEYARDIAGLNFYAMTDHSLSPKNNALLRGLSESTWDQYTTLTEQHNDPPRFVTLQAYECSFGPPYGHHNVYFRDKPGALAYPGHTTLPELWKQLQEGNALTIPHHTGKFPWGLRLSVHDENFRRNFELYSAHGLNEEYDPSHPLAFEQSLFTWDSKTLNQSSHLQDAWRMGQLLSVIASSDDHFSQPGQPHYGLAAVRAPQLTRDAIFQGLYDRQTYATTGARIILEFDINGASMGQAVRVESNPDIRTEAVGTDEIDWLELLRHQPGDDRFHVVRRWRPEAWSFAISYVDEDFKPGAMYYIRLKQKHEIRNRAVMAWSSPIWTSE